MQASKVDLAAAMKSESGGVVGGRGRAWIRSGLVLVQVSLSFILLVGAGAAAQESPARQDTDLGFSAKDVLTAASIWPALDTTGRACEIFKIS